MRNYLAPLLLAALVSAGCRSKQATDDVDTSVRAFAQAVAHDVTHDGPAAWRKHFSDSPAFFMASEGHMVFPNSPSATVGIQDLTRAIKRIELRWGTDLRVDPLSKDLAMVAGSYREVLINAAGVRADEMGFFTGLAERRDGRWTFRDAHWSVAVPPAPAR